MWPKDQAPPNTPSEHDAHEVIGGHVYLQFFWQGSAHSVKRSDMIPWLQSEFAVGCDDHGYVAWRHGAVLN